MIPQQATTPQENNERPLLLVLLSNVVSMILQPLVIPTLAFGVILFGFPTLFGGYSFKIKMNLLVFVNLITMVIPILFILMLKRFGFIKSLQMKDRTERIIPMMVVSGIYVSLAVLLVTRLHINPVFSSVMVSIAFVTAMVTMVTFFWQISAHSASVGGLLSLLFLLNAHIENGLMYAAMLLFIIVSGVVMSARLYLNAHSLAQVVAGFVLGFVINLLVILRLFGEI
jgi:membrane-associated phospholipid phosphatase